MFIGIWVSSSALFNFLVGLQAIGVSLPSGDVIFAQLACPLNDIIFGLNSLYKHWN